VSRKANIISTQISIDTTIGSAIFATQAKRVRHEMFVAAGQAVADQVPSDLLEQGLLYPLQTNVLETEIQTAARVASVTFDAAWQASIGRLTWWVLFAFTCIRHNMRPTG